MHFSLFVFTVGEGSWEALKVRVANYIQKLLENVNKGVVQTKTKTRLGIPQGFLPASQTYLSFQPSSVLCSWTSGLIAGGIPSEESVAVAGSPGLPVSELLNTGPWAKWQ